MTITLPRRLKAWAKLGEYVSPERYAQLKRDALRRAARDAKRAEVRP